MRTLSVYDIVRITSLIKETTAKVEDSFTILGTGDQVTFMPCVFSNLTTLKVYLNFERIETSKASFRTGDSISNVSIVRIIEELDEKVSEKYNRG